MTPLQLIPLMLAGFAILTMTGNAIAEDWPQWLGPKRDGVWRESGIVDRFPTNGLKVTWRTAVAGGYSAPAVAGGRVIITDRLATTNLVAPMATWPSYNDGVTTYTNIPAVEAGFNVLTNVVKVGPARFFMLIEKP